jgi:hypothetical protein
MGFQPALPAAFAPVNRALNPAIHWFGCAIC